MKKLISLIAALMIIGSTMAQKHPYAVVDNYTLTLYYDDNEPEGRYFNISDNYELQMNFRKVVFDKSMKDYRPTSCKNWFAGLYNLVEIVDMEKYLVTDEVTDMSGMFEGCEHLTSLNLSGFNTSKVTDMSQMFYGCYSLATVYVSDKWVTNPSTQLKEMFSECLCKNLIRNGKPYRPDEAHVRPYAICNGSVLTFYYGVSPVGEDITMYLQKRNSNITKIVLDASFKDYIPISCDRWFRFYSELTEIVGMDKYLCTDNVIDMTGMFEYCSKLTELDLSGFNTENFKYMNCMFLGCRNLSVVYVGDQWGTESVSSDKGKNMFALESYYFGDNNKYFGVLCGGKGTCAFYARVDDVSYAKIDGGESSPGYFTKKGEPAFVPEVPYKVVSDSTVTYYYGKYDVEKGMPFFPIIYSNRAKKVVFDQSFKNYRPTSCSGWFRNFSNLTEIVGMEKYLCTEDVTDMSDMFKYCEKLTKLDLSGFNTSKVTNMSNMFYGCNKLSTIYVGDKWNTASVTKSDGLFRFCHNLYGGKGSNGAESELQFARIDGGKKSPGYFTKKGQPEFKRPATDQTTDPFYVYFKKSPQSYFRFNNGVLTYYYGILSEDDFKKIREENDSWAFDDVRKIVFDKSYKDYWPKDLWCFFEHYPSLIEIVDMEKYLNTDSVISMAGMFKNCRSLQKVNLSHFNTSNVTNMNSMFYNCASLTELDLSSFKTDKVTDMGDMFDFCGSLATVYVSDGWSTASIEDHDNEYNLSVSLFGVAHGGIGYENMFTHCGSLVGGKGTPYGMGNGKAFAKIDGGTSSPGYFTRKDGSERKLPYAVLNNGTLTFYYNASKPANAYAVTSLRQTPDWSPVAALITKVVFDPSFKDFYPESCYEWFSGCGNLEEIVGMKENLNTEKVKNMSAMFFCCAKLKSLDLSGFKTNNVENMHSMFSCCVSLEKLDLSSFDTEKVRHMAFMFDGCINLKGINLKSFNTSNTKFMNSMFFSCESLKTLNVSNFDTRNVDRMEFMFGECRSLTTIDLSNFHTQKVHYFDNSGMFMNCKSLSYLDVSSFEFDIDAGISGMFFGCSGLKKIKLFELSGNEDYYNGFAGSMAGLFYGCTNLAELDLTRFKISNPLSLYYTFADCRNLKKIYVSNNWEFNYSHIEQFLDENEEIIERLVEYPYNFSYVTYHCPKLIGGKGTKYNKKNASDMNYLRIDGGKNAPGYFSQK